MNHKEKAMELFLGGYNCAQSVIGAFAQDIGLTEKQAMRIASGFGGGLGRLRETCGVVSGMVAVIGMLYGYDRPQAPEEKAETYALVQKLVLSFREQEGSILCSELLGRAFNGSPIPEERSPEYYAGRPCPRLVGLAASIVEEYMQEHPPKYHYE